jgi:two-component system OmpR family sensor kinase
MKSLRAQLLVLLTAAVLAAAIVQAVVVFENSMREADAVFDYHLQQMALALSNGDLGWPALALPGQDGDDIDDVVQIWSLDGRRLYVSRADPSLPAQAVLGYTNLPIAGTPWRVFAMQAGWRIIQVAQPLSSRRALALTFALEAVWPMLLIAPLLLLAVAWVVRRSLRPLRELAGELESRAATSFDPLEPKDAMLEMQPVVRAMNGLFARTRQAFDAQQMFVADAAHELRSPLTALKLQTQMLGRARDEATQRLALQRLGAGLDRATHLVEQLLTLARADSASQEALQVSSLSEAARLALSDTLELAQACGVDAGLAHDEDLRVQATAAGLRTLVRNLLDNALRHSPRGGRVDLSVHAEAGQALLEVDDSGPGIPAAERERVFDRFYRREDAPPGGSGLGLAIVRSIAERSGARVTLLDSPLGGLRVRVAFPRPA